MTSTLLRIHSRPQNLGLKLRCCGCTALVLGVLSLWPTLDHAWEGGRHTGLLKGALFLLCTLYDWVVDGATIALLKKEYSLRRPKAKAKPKNKCPS